MKVLILTSWYPSRIDPVYGSFVLEFAKALAPYCEVTVVAPIPVVKRIEKKLPFTEDEKDGGVRTIRIYYKKPLIFGRIAGLWHFVKGLRLLINSGYRPEVINAHVHYSALPAFWIPALKNTPVAVSEHSSVFLSKKGPGFFSGFLARYIFKRVKIILPVSRYLMDALSKYSGKTPMEVVQNTYDTALFNAKNRAGLKKKTKRLLFVGALVPVKGVDILLRAFSLVTDTSTVLDIVGDGNKRREYEELALTLGVKDRVRFHGFLPKNEVASIMAKSDLFVLASRSETFGCVLMEAAGTGLPSVAVRVGGVSDVVNIVTGVLVPSDSPQAFAKEIDKMLPLLDKYKPEAVSAEAEARFSHKIVGKKLEAILKQLLN